MLCKNCGRELPENAAFCDACGAPIQPEAEETQAVIPETEQPTAEAETAIELEEAPVVEEKPEFAADIADEVIEKPKKKAAKIIIPIVAVIAALAVVFAFFSAPIINFFNRTFKSDAEYFAYINEKDISSLSKFAGKVFDAYSGADASKGIGFGTEISAELTKEGKKALVALAGDDSVSDYIDWFNNLKISAREDNFAGKDIKFAFKGDINGKEIISGDLISKDETIYIDIPILNKKALKSNIVPQNGEKSSVELIKKLQEALPSGKQAEAIINRYVKIVLEDIKNVESEKAELPFGEIEQKYYEYTATIDGDTAYKIEKDVLKELKNDSEIKDILKKLAENEEFGIDVDEIYDNIDNELENLDKEDFEGMDEIKYICWVDSYGEIIGRCVTMNNESLYYALVKKSGKFELFAGFGKKAFKENDSEFIVKGSGTYDGDKYTGEYNVSAGGEDVFSFEIKALSSNAENGRASGTIIVPLGDIFKYTAVSENSSAVAEILNNYSLKFEMIDKGDKELAVNITLEDAKDVLLKITAQAVTRDAKEITVPSNTVNDETEWAEGIDAESILSRLKEAGMPEDLAELFKYGLGGSKSSDDDFNDDFSDGYYFDDAAFGYGTDLASGF